MNSLAQKAATVSWLNRVRREKLTREKVMKDRAERYQPTDPYYEETVDERGRKKKNKVGQAFTLEE